MSSDISRYGRPAVSGSFFALVCLNFLLLPLSFPDDASVMWTMCIMSVVVGDLLVMTTVVVLFCYSFRYPWAFTICTRAVFFQPPMGYKIKTN